MKVNVPIILIGPEGSETSQIIKETKAGKSFEYSDIDGIKSYLGKIDDSKPPQTIDSFNRKNLTRKLSSIFQSVI